MLIRYIGNRKKRIDHERRYWRQIPTGNQVLQRNAGHIAENLALAAVALGLGSCQIAALYDDEVNTLLDIDGKQESVLYMSVVGRPLRPPESTI